MNTYKILFGLSITVVVVIGVVIGIPVAKSFVGLSDYDLYVDAIIDNLNSKPIGQVLIQNTGSQPLTNVKVDFGEDDFLNLGTIDVRDRIIITSPQGNKMESVTVSADQNILVNKSYREGELPN